MYLVLALVLSVALLSGPILSEDKKKSDNIVVPEGIKSPRKRNPDHEFNPYVEIGRALAAIVTECRAILVNFLKQVNEPANKVKGEVESLKSSLQGRKSSSDNVVSGFVGLVKDTRSIIFRVLQSLTSPAEGMGKMITNHLEKSVLTDQHLKDISEHVGYEDMASESDKSDSYSFFYEDTTHFPLNKTKEEQSKILINPELRAEMELSENITHQNSTTKFKPRFMTHSEEYQKLWKPVLRMNEEQKKRRTTTKRYTKRPSPIRRQNEYLSMYDDYESSKQTDSWENRLKVKTPAEYLTHSEEYERKWRPIIKQNSWPKPGKRLLGGKTRTQKSMKSVSEKNVQQSQLFDTFESTLNNKIVEDASRLDFEHLLNSMQKKKSASGSRTTLRSKNRLSSRDTSTHTTDKQLSLDIRGMDFDPELATRKSFVRSLSRTKSRSKGQRKLLREKQFETVASRIGQDQNSLNSASKSANEIMLTPRPNTSRIGYDKCLDWRPNKKKDKIPKIQDNPFGKSFGPARYGPRRIKPTSKHVFVTLSTSSYSKHGKDI